MYRGLLIDCTSCWLLSHLGLLRLERSGARVLVLNLVLPVYHFLITLEVILDSITYNSTVY